ASARRDAGSWLGAGACFGAAILAVPTFVFSFALLLAWGAVTRAASWRALVYCAAAAALIVGAWSVRNHALFGSYVFVSTNGGLNLLLGNSKHTTPAAGTNVDISAYQKASQGQDEVTSDAYYRRQALAWISANPGAAAELYAGKVLHYFAFEDELATKGEQSRARTWLMIATYGPLLLLLALRLSWLRRLPPNAL